MLVLAGPALAGVPAAASVCVVDDAEREVCLDQPARRIVSLSPGATELLFAAGAGDRIVGAVTHSDYPPEARTIPRIGSYKRLDMEALLARRPDLVVGWISGNPAEQLERLRQLDQPIYLSEPRALDDVARTLERLGRLAGSAGAANAAAAEYRDAIASIRARYADRDPVRVFYQVWPDPLMTVNDEHLISQVAALCGGVNVFGDLDSLTPRVDRESVLARDPEAIVTGGMGEADASWLDAWRRFEHMQAVRQGNLFFVPPSSIQRPTPRLVQGARTLCRHLEVVRGRR
ncbi:cobalamin-binding protein [Aquisalimonas lutea]|uniref:cobalamin-binding protein n=1 Tax=Aquisalimonas lutea TaxID=1327750 RepID=UPI0025B49D38|nr:cobalamin-binding protein [Aquisalimonas lutea]MDN3516745.1 cobalamin-binding protein [Aquisalimonas lutea]